MTQMESSVTVGGVGFIGAGMMATALMKGLIAANTVSASQIIAADPFSPSLKKLESEGIQCAVSNLEVVSKSRVVWLAVKPGVIPNVVEEIASAVTSEHLIISIAAGVTLETIQQRLPPGTRVIRVMPNTPCLVRETAAAFATGPSVTPADVRTVEAMLGSVGLAVRVQEKQMDAVTAVSGSGPAFVFLMLEAMADGGVRAGLTRDVALRLAAQTIRGSATMHLATGAHPGVLKDQVTSPGGTTVAGVAALEAASFRGAVMQAVAAAAERSQQLSKL